MKVVVTNVNYFNNSFASPMAGYPSQSGATVNFSAHSSGQEAEGIGSFSLNYSNLSGPVPFFPGEVFNLSFDKVSED